MNGKLLCFSVFALVFATSVESASQTYGDLEDLTFKLECRYTQLYPLEAIPLRLTVSNDTSQTIIGSLGLVAGSQYLTLYLYDPQEGYLSIWPAHWPILATVLKPMSMEPGFTHTIETYIGVLTLGGHSRSAKQFILSKPGEAKIKAVLKSNNNGGETLESNVLTLTAVQPTGIDAAAYAYLMKHPTPWFLMLGIWKRGFELRETFLAKFPTSRYAAYGFYRTGIGLKGQRDPLLRDKAPQYFEKAASFESCFVAPLALEKMVEIYLKKNNLPEAKRALSLITERYPGSRSARNASSMAYKVRLHER